MLTFADSIKSVLAIVKKGIIYIAFFITFLNGITLNQFSKVTFFFTHYIEHYHRNPGIGVIEFLRMHYWGQDINDNDGDKDRQLPFIVFDAIARHLLIFTIPEL